MKYLATVLMGIETSSKSFATEKEAMQWLDENNNNQEFTTKIEMFDDNWRKVDGYFYTSNKE